MSFAKGSVSFRRFDVVGSAAKTPDPELLEKFKAFAIQGQEFGVPEEVEYGWCGGRHIMDNTFSFESNVFADSVNVGIRTDTNKCPGDVKKAMIAIESEAVAKTNPSGFISKAQKREVADKVRQKITEERTTGKYRKSRITPVMWDMTHSAIYSPATNAKLGQLCELFTRTFNLELHPLSAGNMAALYCDAKGKGAAYTELEPTKFVLGPEGNAQVPDYPWISKGVEPKDFLGNEFLLWLWHETSTGNGVFGTDQGDVSVVINRQIDLECAYGMTGKDGIKSDTPTTAPESREAIRIGKLPRKAGVILEYGDSQYEFKLNPETMTIQACKLPDIEDAESARQMFEERIGSLNNLWTGLTALYHHFLAVRLSPAWADTVFSIKQWAKQ